MTVDKFGCNLTHPYHLTKKLKKSQDVIREEEKEGGKLFGFMNIILHGESSIDGNFSINNWHEYRFPIKSGTIEYVEMHPPVLTIINGKEYTTADSLLHQELKFNDIVVFKTIVIGLKRKLCVELVIKYPIKN